eukprot:scaffold13249_cov118-Isochrysis_galbana.AAC.13
MGQQQSSQVRDACGGGGGRSTEPAGGNGTRSISPPVNGCAGGGSPSGIAAPIECSLRECLAEG